MGKTSNGYCPVHKTSDHNPAFCVGLCAKCGYRYAGREGHGPPCTCDVTPADPKVRRNPFPFVEPTFGDAFHMRGATGHSVYQDGSKSPHTVYYADATAPEQALATFLYLEGAGNLRSAVRVPVTNPRTICVDFDERRFFASSANGADITIKELAMAPDRGSPTQETIFWSDWAHKRSYPATNWFVTKSRVRKNPIDYATHPGQEVLYTDPATGDTKRAKMIGMHPFKKDIGIWVENGPGRIVDISTLSFLDGSPVGGSRAKKNSNVTLRRGYGETVACVECVGTGTEDGKGMRICAPCRGTGLVPRPEYRRHAEAPAAPQGRITAKKNPNDVITVVVVDMKKGEIIRFRLPGDAYALMDHLEPGFDEETTRLWGEVQARGVSGKVKFVQSDWPTHTLTFTVAGGSYYPTINNPVWIRPEGSARAQAMERAFDEAYDNPGRDAYAAFSEAAKAKGKTPAQIKAAYAKQKAAEKPVNAEKLTRMAAQEIVEVTRKHVGDPAFLWGAGMIDIDGANRTIKIALASSKHTAWKVDDPKYIAALRAIAKKHAAQGLKMTVAVANPGVPRAWIKGIQDYAMKNYETGGWDFVVETMDDGDIEKTILGDKNYGVQPCTSYEEAFKRVKKLADSMGDRRRDIESA